MKLHRFERVVVLLDSSSPAGDAGVAFAAALLGADGYMTLAVSLAGPAASGLAEFADAEGVTISEAADIYLEQVAERLGPYRVNTRLMNGADAIADLLAVVEESNSNAAVVPAPLAAQTLATAGAWAGLRFPVLVVPEGPAPA